MGAIVTRDDELFDVLKKRRDMIGAVPGPMEAYLALRGLRTLHLRVERAQSNAKELVRRLEAHPAVGEVRYPGFGGIISIVLAQGALAADLLTHKTEAVGPCHFPRWGGVDVREETSLEDLHATIPDALVRMSVGIEDVDDLWADLERALNDLR